MTEWRIEGARASARCKGYDIQAWWGTGRDLEKIIAEGSTLVPGRKAPEREDHGVIARTKSGPKQMDGVRMIVIPPNLNDPEEAIRRYTAANRPEDMLPQYEDWEDEWDWVNRYQHTAKWKRIGNQATAFIGPLTLTVKLTTVKDAIQQVKNATETEDGNFESSPPREGQPKEDEPTFVMELREDLDLVAILTNATRDNGIETMKEFTSINAPTDVAMACAAHLNQEDEEPAPRQPMLAGPGEEGGCIVFRNGKITDHCDHNENGVCGRCLLLEAHEALGEALSITTAPEDAEQLAVEESLGRLIVEALACIERNKDPVDFHAMSLIAAIRTGHHRCGCGQCRNWEKWRAGEEFEDIPVHYNRNAVPMKIDPPGNPQGDGQGNG